MGMLNYYNDTNKVITKGKAITYSSEIEHGSWSYKPAVNIVQTYTHDYRITRTCQYSYQYVGMDLSTANQCKAYFENQLKRNTRISTWNNNLGVFTTENGGQRLMAEIAVQWVEGKMYNCTIDINEVDERMSINQVPTLSSLFSQENQRQYDFVGRS